MKTFASDVAPTATPSIGTGNASATRDATSSAATPASVLHDGPEAANDQIAAAATTAPPTATGATTGSRRACPPRKRGLPGLSRLAEASLEGAATCLAAAPYQVQPSPSPAKEAMN